MIGPLRDALCATLGQPKAAWSSGSSAGPPPRVVPSVPQPNVRDLQRLRRACQSMSLTLVELRGQLEDTHTSECDVSLASSAVTLPVTDAQEGAAGRVCIKDADADSAIACSTLGLEDTAVFGEGVTLSTDAPEARAAELEGLCGRLYARVRDLEAPAARAADLERVAQKLRVRVKDLETQEARIDKLRHECSTLRMRVAELVASAVQTEEEHKTLLTHVGRLEMRVKDGADTSCADRSHP